MGTQERLPEAVIRNMSGPNLVELHNKWADKPVKKFSDKETAIKRTIAAVHGTNGKAKKGPVVTSMQPKPKAKKAAGEKKTRTRRGMFFNFIAVGDRKPITKETPQRPVLRERLITGLREGITFDDAVKIVEKFDEDRIELGIIKKTAECRKHVTIRAYEGLRHIHYYANHSMQHVNKEDPFSKIKLISNRKA